ICSLPPEPAAYRDTPLGGDVPPQSTLVVRVQTTSGTRVWDERADLVHSDDSDEHYCLETDEHGHSVIRFGDGANGMTLPDLAHVLVSYQTALGADGNIGADRLKRIETASLFLNQSTCWNPFDASNGRAPESVERIIRRAPEMFRFRQL